MSGTNTWSCKDGSTGFSRMTLDSSEVKNLFHPVKSVQYWNIFLYPPPFCRWPIHIRINQYTEFGNADLTSFFNVQKLWGCLSGAIILFEFGKLWESFRLCSLGSISIQMLSGIGILVGEGEEREEMKLALVSPSLQVCLLMFENILQFSTLELQVALCLLHYSHCHQEFVFSLSDLSRICPVRSKLWSTIEIRLQIKNQFSSQLLAFLSGDWSPLPIPDQCLYLHESILLVLMIRHLEVMCTLDMPRSHQIQKNLPHLSSWSIVQRQLFWQILLLHTMWSIALHSKRFCTRSLWLCNRLPCACSLVWSGLWIFNKSADPTVDFDCSISA